MQSVDQTEILGKKRSRSTLEGSENATQIEPKNKSLKVQDHNGFDDGAVTTNVHTKENELATIATDEKSSSSLKRKHVPNQDDVASNKVMKTAPIFVETSGTSAIKVNEASTAKDNNLLRKQSLIHQSYNNNGHEVQPNGNSTTRYLSAPGKGGSKHQIAAKQTNLVENEESAMTQKKQQKQDHQSSMSTNTNPRLKHATTTIQVQNDNNQIDYNERFKTSSSASSTLSTLPSQPPPHQSKDSIDTFTKYSESSQSSHDITILSILTILFLVNIPITYLLLLATFESDSATTISTIKYISALLSIKVLFSKKSSTHNDKINGDCLKSTIDDNELNVVNTTIDKAESNPSNLKIMSILALLFFVNIGATFTILSAIFTNIKSFGSFKSTTTFLLSWNVLLAHSLSTKPSLTILKRHHPHVIHPQYLLDRNVTNNNIDNYISNITLRQFLADERGFHLGLAPAFFGFYVYYGTLAALHENVLSQTERDAGLRLIPQSSDVGTKASPPLLKTVAGASAGAMAAVLLASGLNPRESADFASSMTLGQFADPFGFGGVLKGEMFEEIMVDLLREKTKGILRNNDVDDNEAKFRLEDGLIPIGVTVFDLLTMSTKTLTKGCAGRAARASACFPVLFQPVTWPDQEGIDDINNGMNLMKTLKQKLLPPNLFIDGGVQDPYGLVGLTPLNPDEKGKRIVNLIAGSFGTRGGIPGPSRMPDGLQTSQVLSISVENAPRCGPDKMQNGPRAVAAALNAVKSALDAKLYHGEEENHFILNIDAAAFAPQDE